MTKARQTEPGQFYQGKDEDIPYTIDVSNWTAAPTAACVVVTLNGSDATSDVVSGAQSISGSTITTGCITSLSAGEDYRVDIRFEQDGIAWECYFFITGED